MDFTNPHADTQTLAAIESAIQQAGGSKKRFIFVSGFLIGEPLDTASTEESPTLSEASLQELGHPIGTLLRSRIEAEKQILGSKQYIGVVVRPAMVYGGLKSHWTIHFKNAEEGKVVVYGDGNTAISFVHVDDIVDALVRIVNAEESKVEHQIFALAEPERTTQREVAYALARGTGKELNNLKEETTPIPFSLFRRGDLWINPAKAKNVLGWSPNHNLTRDSQVLYDSWKALGTQATW